jgi:toxin YoeB
VSRPKARKLPFHPDAWDEYTELHDTNRRLWARVNALSKDIQRNGDEAGIGKPELLRGNLRGYCSRRIDQRHRLVYGVGADTLEIISCLGHYE